jgi:hypothetical protein
MNDDPLYVRCTKLIQSPLKIKISIIFNGNVGNEDLQFTRLALLVLLAVPVTQFEKRCPSVIPTRALR